MLRSNCLDAGFQAIGGDVVQDDVKAGERAYVRNAVAHLARADDAYGPNATHSVCTPVLSVRTHASTRRM